MTDTALAEARNNALEEAAVICDQRAKITINGKTYWATTEEHAKAIRALKDVTIDAAKNKK